MSLLSKLFGSKPKAEKKAEVVKEVYKDFTITPTPIKDGGRYRISALIEKDGRSHTLIRADMLDDLETANQSSVAKAKRMIDEQGSRLFD